MCDIGVCDTQPGSHLAGQTPQEWHGEALQHCLDCHQVDEGGVELAGVVAILSQVTGHVGVQIGIAEI